MRSIGLVCRSATTFSPAGELDEAALRLFLHRLVDADIGVYLASGGSGEGHALTDDELGRLYRIGVEVCKGRVSVNANIPEHHTATVTRARAEQAVAAGVDVINIYGPASWHGFRPTEAEHIAYYDNILPFIKHPVALAPLPVLGYTPSPAFIASLCHKYHQVVAVHLSALGEGYFVQLKNRLTRRVEIYVPLSGAVEALLLGASGIVSASANVLPKTYRRYADLFGAGKLEELASVYADILSFDEYVLQWQHGTPRWMKTMMKVLKLPGGEGGCREPYKMLDGADLQQFTRGLIALGIPEIDELAVAAGLRDRP
jgi:4-hydroxy-tetrahydrodipicolinate synthase